MMIIMMRMLTLIVIMIMMIVMILTNMIMFPCRFYQSPWLVGRRRNQRWFNMRACMRRSQYDDDDFKKNDIIYIVDFEGMTMWLTILMICNGC